MLQLLFDISNAKFFENFRALCLNMQQHLPPLAPSLFQPYPGPIAIVCLNFEMSWEKLKAAYYDFFIQMVYFNISNFFS